MNRSGISPARQAWQRLRANRAAVVAGIVAIVVVTWCVLGPLLMSALAGIESTDQDVLLGATAPSWHHWMGTDILGRDLMVRTMIGGRIAIAIGLLATLMAMVIGVGWGALAGYAGGRVDELMMRVVDVIYALPMLVVVIVIMALLETRSVVVLVLFIGSVSWLMMARITRAQVLSLKQREFVDAARGLGLRPSRILLRHLVPNALGPVVAYASLAIPGAMLFEAFLSFLGLGVQPPAASLGSLVSEGAGLLLVYPWTLIGPGVVMVLALVALNFLGDGLRDALDPRAAR
ncbi:MAG: ABC transporter permease [Deltaproteobacteria bacterium]|nr:ABC transporter permease [Deltaproteobacteria bacterium]